MGRPLIIEGSDFLITSRGNKRENLAIMGSPLNLSVTVYRFRVHPCPTPACRSAGWPARLMAGRDGGRDVPDIKKVRKLCLLC